MEQLGVREAGGAVEEVSLDVVLRIEEDAISGSTGVRQESE